MKLYIGLILYTCGFSCIAQELNIIGQWNGTVSYLNTQSYIVYEFEKTGSEISGYSTLKSIDGKDSAKIALDVKQIGKKLKLTPTDFIYKVGTFCASVSELTYSNQDGQEKLLGKWKGDMSFLTCPPFTGGTITVYRERPKSSSLTSEDSNEQLELSQIGETDKIGQALITELQKRTYYALVIGVDQYQDKEILSLDNPVKDAQAIAQVLKTHYTFEEANVKVLTNPKRGEIIDALDALSTKVNSKDNLIVFFAGHGIWNNQLNQGYWLPSDAKFNSKANWLSNSTLRDYLGGINSKHTLLIADACFSGGILKERAVFENSKAILEVYKLPSRKAMTSGTLKTVPDKSVFIEYLLKNLIQNEAPLLSAHQLFTHFKIAVINNSPNGQVPQYGPISQAGDEGGDFIFLKRLP